MGDRLCHLIHCLRRGAVSAVPQRGSRAESAFPEVDATLAATHMVLMAQSLGLGTCFSGLLVFALQGSPALRALLQIPSEHRAPVAFVVGHPGVTFLRLVARKPAMALWL